MDRQDFEYREQAYQEDLAKLKKQIDQEIAAEFEQERQKVERDNVSAAVKDGTFPVGRTHERREKDAKNTQNVFDQRRQGLETRETAKRNELLQERQKQLELLHFEELGKRDLFLDMYRRADQAKERLLARVQTSPPDKTSQNLSKQSDQDVGSKAEITPGLSAEELKQRKIAQIKQEFLDKSNGNDPNRGDDFNR